MTGSVTGSVTVDDADRCSPGCKGHVEKDESLYEDFGEAAVGYGRDGVAWNP